MSIQSLLKFRYALGQGAASFAVDIEEAEHDGVSEGIAAAVRLSQHQIQRRNEKSFLKEESTGDAYNLFAFPSGVLFNRFEIQPSLGED
ncbi:hypothetical protein CMV_001205 [Castanea mollissima]|uniref:Uncharacterized protein n=1 Tax=Castanea mollissima TaxID=60419 RepID=A0A8J4RW46_9ROSI|nr:hypothetical protein CMV_001205 [Castanea mollissima]